MNEQTSTGTAGVAVADPGPGGLWLWIRSLGFVRRDGWIGGVCAAVAYRLGVDPLVVRGMFVVATLLGFPGLWLYAIGWALLPDREGRIPFGPGRVFDPALFGIAVNVVLAILATLGGFSLTSLVWGFSAATGLAALFVALLVIAVIVVATIAFIIWLARRRSALIDLPRRAGDLGGGASGPAATGGAASGRVAPPTSPAAAPVEPQEPLSPLTSAEDLEAWRSQHAAWREQHERWRQQQLDAERLAAEEERDRRRSGMADFRAEAARLRAIRRASKPRTSFAFIAVTAGTALLVGVGTWLAFQPSAAERAVPAAVLAAAAVVALAMVVAGLVRRRSGFLALVTVVLLAIGAFGLFAHTFEEFVLPGATRYPPEGTYEIVQPFGDLTLAVGPWSEGDGTTTVEKGNGMTYLDITDGVDVTLQLTSDAGSLFVSYYDPVTGESRSEEPVLRDGRATWTFDGGSGVPQRTIVLKQQQGDVNVQVWEEPE